MIPKRFRDHLTDVGDTTVWITNGLGNGPLHMDVRPNTTFKAYFERVSTFRETVEIVEFKRFYFGSAIEVPIDSAGRLLIPVQLRNRCRLIDKVAFVGVDAERFELWRPADLDQTFEYCSQKSVELMNHLAELGVK